MRWDTCFALTKRKDVYQWNYGFAYKGHVSCQRDEQPGTAREYMYAFQGRTHGKSGFKTSQTAINKACLF